MSATQTKFPMLPRVHVSRQSLLAKLSRAMECKLTVVCAAAGYGKTTLAAEFASQFGPRAEWRSLLRADRDIALLAARLDGCLRRLASRPNSRSPGQPLAAPTGQPSVAVLGEMLLRQAARIGPQRALLVLDDYQNVDQEEDVNLLLGSFIQHSPPHLHFLLLSRSTPRFALAELRARQEFSLLQEEDLAFTEEETSLFLCEESQLEVNDDALAQVHRRTEGWPAAIAMVAQSLRYDRRDKVMSILADPVASAWLVYDYLAEAVFDTQEEEVKEFLTKTSVLSRMSAPVCDCLLERASSQRTLLALEERGLFTVRTDPARQQFRYHQLFREFLRQKLHQRESRETVRSLHLAAGRHYEQTEAWNECITHYVKADEPLKAALVVERVGERFILAGFYQTVEYWLKTLPEEVTSTRPSLLVLAGMVTHMAARHEEALRLLERALRLFQAEGDLEGQARTMGEMGFVSCKAGMLQQSVRYFESALPLAGDRSLKCELMAMYSQPLRDLGLLQAAKDCLSDVLAELAVAGDDPRRLRLQSRAARNLAVTQMELGDLEGAKHTVEENLASSVATGIGEYEETFIRIHLGAVLWANGDLEEAVQSLNRALSLSGRYIRFQQHLIGLWLGNSYRDARQFEQAKKAYAFAGWNAEPEKAFLEVLVHRGQLARAVAEDMYRRCHRSESPAVRSSSEVVFGAALRETQEPEAALGHLIEAVRILAHHGYRHRLASALLHQARLQYELLRLAEARETLERGLHMASEAGYYQFHWWDPEMVAYLCYRALSDGICPDYAVTLATRRLGGSEATIVAPLLRDPRTGVRRRAMAILSSMPRREVARLREETLSGCSDEGVRDSLLQAINDGVISRQGIRILRTRYRASWREVQVLIHYYLRPALEPLVLSAQLRQECGQRLNISDNTVRCHVNNLRGKLGLPRAISGERVLEWAQQEGLLPESE